MSGAIVLPPGVALAIIAFLLSLLPAGLFIWLWYLRHHERPVPARTVTLAFLAGLVLLLPAFWIEQLAERIWGVISPGTAHYFVGAVLPLTHPLDILLPALATFLVVALVEEGLRYGLLRIWIRRSKVIDQVFDGLVLGVAAGLGFATLENTIYFLGLFQTGSYDTLVFVFFLRFLISTLAHISFGGLMGVLIARGVFELYRPGQYFWQAFLIPWFLHGLYDLLLGVNQSLYAVLMLLPPLGILIAWAGRKEFFAVQRKNGRLLISQQAPEDSRSRLFKQLVPSFRSPWNVQAPWLSERRVARTLRRKQDV